MSEYFCCELKTPLDLNEHADLAGTPEPFDDLQKAQACIIAASHMEEQPYAVLEVSFNFLAGIAGDYTYRIHAVAYQGDLFVYQGDE